MEPTVAITGATSGIGRAVAEAFVDEGAFVAVSGRDGDAVDQTVAALNESGDEDGGRDEGEGESGSEDAGTAWGARVDVRDEFDLERFFEKVAREAGPIDVVFANAAVFHGGPGEPDRRDELRRLRRHDADQRPRRLRDDRGGGPAPRRRRASRRPVGRRRPRVAVGDGRVRRLEGGRRGGRARVRGRPLGDRRRRRPGLVATDLTGKERARDPESVAPLFVWAATEAPAEDLNGERLGLREWKAATR